MRKVSSYSCLELTERQRVSDLRNVSRKLVMKYARRDEIEIDFSAVNSRVTRVLTLIVCHIRQ